MHFNFTGKFAVLDFGSVEPAILPLVLRHLGVKPASANIVKICEDQSGIARSLGTDVIADAICEGNYECVLVLLLVKGDCSRCRWMCPAWR